MLQISGHKKDKEEKKVRLNHEAVKLKDKLSLATKYLDMKNRVTMSSGGRTATRPSTG